MLPVAEGRPRGPVEQTVRAYGLRLGLRANEPDALAMLLAALPGQWQPSRNGRSDHAYSLVVDGGTRPRYTLFWDEEELTRTRDVERVVEAVIGSVGIYFGEFSPTRTFIHSGAVGWRGRAVLLPGKQNSGKTTLTTALVRAGATYLSDEYAPIDDRGRVHPFARPLSFRREGDLPVRLESVESIGGVQGTRALPVGLVVFAPFRPTRRWRPRRVGPGEGVLELLAFTVSAQTRPRQALERLGCVVTAAPVLKGGRGDADETARLILRRLDKARLLPQS